MSDHVKGKIIRGVFATMRASVIAIEFVEGRDDFSVGWDELNPGIRIRWNALGNIDIQDIQAVFHGILGKKR